MSNFHSNRCGNSRFLKWDATHVFHTDPEIHSLQNPSNKYDPIPSQQSWQFAGYEFWTRSIPYSNRREYSLVQRSGPAPCPPYGGENLLFRMLGHGQFHLRTDMFMFHSISFGNSPFLECRRVSYFSTKIV